MIDHDNLEEFSDPQTYDLEDASDTGVAFYTALARETSGPVLEIACGTGRVGVQIAQQGFAVTGVDLVPGMVEQARRKSAGLPTRTPSRRIWRRSCTARAFRWCGATATGPWSR